MHGGNAPQVRAAREARIVAAEAALEAPKSMAEAGDVLLGAMNDSHALLQRLKQNIANGSVTAADLTALGEWIDRTARVSKAVVDAGVEERRVRMSEQAGALVAQVIKNVLDDLRLSPEQQQRVPVVVPQRLRELAGPR